MELRKRWRRHFVGRGTACPQFRIRREDWKKRTVLCGLGNDITVVEHIESLRKKLESEALCERYILCDVRIKRDAERQVESIAAKTGRSIVVTVSVII